MVPRSNWMTTSDSGTVRVMLQLSMAWAASPDEENATVKNVLRSTLVRGVLSMAPLMLEGLESLLTGCS